MHSTISQSHDQRKDAADQGECPEEDHQDRQREVRPEQCCQAKKDGYRATQGDCLPVAEHDHSHCLPLSVCAYLQAGLLLLSLLGWIPWFGCPSKARN